MKREDALAAFLALVAGAPQRLVADVSPDALWAHVADAEATVPLIAEETGPLVDVGSGAGFPGVPLLLARPDLHGTLLESRAKRCDHLQAVIDATQMHERVVTHVGRAETFAAGPGRDHFGICVARALAPPAVALELCLPLVRPGGVCVLHAGAVDPVALEIAALAVAGTVERIVPVAGFDHRNHVVVRKTGPTPATFPRRTGLAAKQPIVRPAD